MSARYSAVEGFVHYLDADFFTDLSAEIVRSEAELRNFQT